MDMWLGCALLEEAWHFALQGFEYADFKHLQEPTVQKFKIQNGHPKTICLVKNSARSTPIAMISELYGNLPMFWDPVGHINNIISWIKKMPIILILH